MGPIKLILFRVYNLTLGRFTTKFFKKQLTKKLIEAKVEKYTASSKFFDMKELRD
jgi:hypothetical protein